MCGIVGQVNGGKLIDIDSLTRRRDMLTHRGPDDAGIWLSRSKRVGLGHRRLSIIDLSKAGHQPMIRNNGQLVIVFNGEIYNFKTLRQELSVQGYEFTGNSDTEVVLQAYNAWGEQCVNHFNGMFAFAIYDDRNSESGPVLFLARDRTGKKPLYYKHDSKHFEFASELKAIDSYGELDPRALNFYLALGYVPDSMCLFAGINKLPAAHAARFRINSQELEIWRYWQLPDNEPDNNISTETLVEETQELFFDSVQLRLQSDVPLGVLLSGGLDSSLVVAAAAQQSNIALQTFTVAFPGTQYDESNYAKQVAHHFDTKHHILEVPKPSLDVLEELAPFIDEPIADSSLIPSFMVSRLTRQHVTVALGGDGGDELFGGYSDYPVSLCDQERLRWIPQSLVGLAARLAAQLPAGVRGRNRISSLRHGGLQQMIWGSPYFDLTLRKRILETELWQNQDFQLDEPEQWLQKLFQHGKDPVDSMTRTHFGSILPDDFLVKTDRTSMAVGLELRAPFLDYRLTELAFSKIPSHHKVQDTETKRILKRLAKRLLPADLEINRKQGFSIPLDDWLRVNNCEYLTEQQDLLPTMINHKELGKLVKGHQQGRANGARIYALLMLAITMRNAR